jgi:ABC-type multidrug transport system fused ATPase/permease subunit
VAECVGYNFRVMEEKEDKKFTWRELKDMLAGSFKGTGVLYAGIFLLILIAAAGQVAEPIIYGRIIDGVVMDVSANRLAAIWDDLYLIIIAWAAATLIGSASRELSQWLSFKAGNKVWDKFSQVILNKVLNWDPERFGRIALGALAKRLERAGEASWELAARTVVDIIPTLVTFIVFLVVGCLIDWRMTLVCLATVPILLLMTLFAYRFADKRQEQLNEAWEEVSRKLYEVVANIIPIKSYNAEGRILREYTKLIDVGLARQTRLNTVWTVLDFSNGAIRFIARFIALIVGVYFISEGSLSIGTLITFLGMMAYILAPFDYLLAGILRRTSETRTAFSRLAEDWYAENNLIEPSRPKRLKDIKGEIIFNNVSYRYTGSRKEVLSNISLTVKPGTSLAIVGPSGSGKTTLIRFINRFLDPTGGSVSIDGIDLREAKVEDVRDVVGVVHQDTVMFNESIFENVQFVKPGASKEEVIAACKKAQAHEFIERLEKGYDTMVGERGVRMSGGERQRLALARVFLADPPVLILDESTSALDSETEGKLQVALKSAMKGRTTIIIAHRLSTVYMADQIAVIEQGKLVELGTHDELLREGGLYEKLWRLQSGGYLPD